MAGDRRLLRVLRRTLLQAVPTVLGIVVLNFLLLQLAPGDAADVMAGEAGSATEETMAQLRARFGLDLPVLEQLLAYLGNLAHLSLGFSPRYNMPVADLIAQRLPGTLLLMGLAILIALALGIALGAVMAMNAGGWRDRVLSVAALLFYSVPGFWIGLMLIVLFSVKLGWLPSGGAETIGSSLTGAADFALAWVLNNRLITSAIVGPRTEAQWESYLPALRYRLTAEDEAFVDSLVAPGHASTHGFNDPSHPVEGRQPYAPPAAVTAVPGSTRLAA